jgi:hypothetical protein
LTPLQGMPPAVPAHTAVVLSKFPHTTNLLRAAATVVGFTMGNVEER